MYTNSNLTGTIINIIAQEKIKFRNIMNSIAIKLWHRITKVWYLIISEKIDSYTV